MFQDLAKLSSQLAEKWSSDRFPHSTSRRVAAVLHVCKSEAPLPNMRTASCLSRCVAVVLASHTVPTTPTVVQSTFLASKLLPIALSFVLFCRNGTVFFRCDFKPLVPGDESIFRASSERAFQTKRFSSWLTVQHFKIVIKKSSRCAKKSPSQVRP